MVHESPASPQAGPLDLASASLDQQGTELQLEITTRGGAWKPSQLDHRGPRTLCLTLAYGTTRTALCLAGPKGRAILRRVPLTPAGRPARVAATVTHEGRTLKAAFTPADVGLPFGPFKWSVVTSWNGGVDQLPEVEARARLFAVPECFGAAAREPGRPCANPLLRTVVTPTPDEALLTPNAPCNPYNTVGLVYPCYFGVASYRAKGTVALLGDSHAEHWRAAIEVVAQRRRWRGISLSRTSCPFNTAGAKLRTALATDQCRRWIGQVRAFLAGHREVHTVFVAARASAEFERDAANGAREALRSLPKSVRRIYVLRATPETLGSEAPCVDRRRRARVTIGSTCAISRQTSLRADPQLRAAGGRVKVLDFTSYFCDASRCPSVIGGVLVRKDGSHLTRAFSGTLGPFVLRAVS